MQHLADALARSCSLLVAASKNSVGCMRAISSALYWLTVEKLSFQRRKLALVVEHVEHAGQRLDDVVRERLLASDPLLGGASLADVDADADERGARRRA